MENYFLLYKNIKLNKFYIFFVENNFKKEISYNLYNELKKYKINYKNNYLITEKITNILSNLKSKNDSKSRINIDLSMFNCKQESIYNLNNSIEVVFFGFPYDLGSSNYAGSRLAPKLLREYSISLYEYFNDSFVKFPLDARDIGDISGRIYKTNGFEFEFSSNIVEILLSFNKIPIILGGDHSISFSTIKGVINSKKEFGIIQFDAHQDFQTDKVVEYEWNEYLHHGNFLNWILGNSEVRVLYQLGLDEYSKFYKHDKIKSFTTQEVLDNIDYILSTLDNSLEYYITFDVDCLSTEFITSTGTPIPGGFSYRELKYIINKLSEYNIKIIALDFVELNDRVRMDSANVCKIILDFINILR